MPIPLILIHGYSDVGTSFKTWRDELLKKGLYGKNDIRICNYRTLTNEVTIKDIAEGFNRALQLQADLKDDEPFDAIVHSTGMLVLRSWLTVYGRHQRLKRIIAIAPASFGSPLAHKGRSWIGAIFKGNRQMGGDFLEAGNLVLDGLELASKFTWDLAHKDLLDKDHVFYGPNDDTPYVFTFCGNTEYGGLRGAITHSPGTDGTVRWSGCALNSRKIILDLTKTGNEDGHYSLTQWPTDKRLNLMMPFIPIRGLTHATILEDPSKELVDLVAKALQVTDFESYKNWIQEATSQTNDTLENMKHFQQFIVRARDERQDPISDYNLQLYQLKNGGSADNADDWELVDMDVHAYGADNSYRCFHINLDNLTGANERDLMMEFTASSGSTLLGYFKKPEENEPIPQVGDPTFTMDLTPLFKDADINFFHPFTTTLIEIILNREPLPFRQENQITTFISV
jgi:hypothetical protein